MTTTSYPVTELLALSWPGGWEWIVIFIVALLIFGNRLPDVARSVGKSIVEFKKGLKDVTQELDVQSRKDAKGLDHHPDSSGSSSRGSVPRSEQLPPTESGEPHSS